MAHTVTQEEYNKMKENVLTMCAAKIREYVNKNLLGYRTTQDYRDSIATMVICKKALDTWEQGRFHNVQYSNYYTDTDLLNLFTKIKKLTYVQEMFK